MPRKAKSDGEITAQASLPFSRPAATQAPKQASASHSMSQTESSVPPTPSASGATAPSNGPRKDPGSKDQPLSVDQLVRGVNRLFEQYIGTIWVEGEISNLRRPGSGHLYFILKDASSQLPCVMWRSNVARLAMPLEEGQCFSVRGHVNVYGDHGKFQLYAEAAEPAGLGAAALALEQLKKRLAKEGLFAVERKRQLPFLPRQIGVVTSATGAAVRDITRTVERRFPISILVSPTRVQGEGAGTEIANAIRRINQFGGCDVLIVGRGGGSAEDLSAFNDEAVVRAIAESPVPVISAVGHEVDITLADLVADVRAATPTAAAELAVPEKRELRESLQKTESRLAREASHTLSKLRHQLESASQRLGDPTHLLERGRQRIDEIELRIAQVVRDRIRERRDALFALREALRTVDPKSRLATNRLQVSELLRRAELATSKLLQHRRMLFEKQSGRLDAMSPLKVLDRGYAIAQSESGAVWTDSSKVKVGDAAKIRLAHGELRATVNEVLPPAVPKK